LPYVEAPSMEPAFGGVKSSQMPFAVTFAAAEETPRRVDE